MRAALAAFALVGVILAASTAHADVAGAGEKPAMPGGELRMLGPDRQVRGVCPLKHTDVQADVAGFIARVKVRQQFHNPSTDKIEAVYVFPLPQDAAVDEMVMTIGERRIVGRMKKREEARQVYEQARAAGHVTALLDQERPNVFTQSVANIEPGAQVTIEIAYCQTLKYEDGFFEMSIPTVVGPRYMPGYPAGGPQKGDGVALDTPQAPDASRISPPLAPAGARAGHDIGITVKIDAGLPIQEIDCRSHLVKVAHPEPAKATIALKNQATFPNKDFVLRYRTATDRIGDALLTHRDERGTFFTLVLQPPRRTERKDAVGRELVFVLDTSGSMSGFPITQANWVMNEAIKSLGPQDTFNLITFAGDTRVLWETARPNNADNVKAAMAFLDSHRGGGGTEMMKAIETALHNPKPDPARIRVVCFMTDGYVGNDMAIIDAVKKNAGTTRVFSFGIGNSVNRFLLDGIAWAGRGEVQYVLLNDDAAAMSKKFYERISAPVLTDIAIDWGDLPVDDVYPVADAVPDLWSVKPLVIKGRLKGDPKDAKGTVTLTGQTAGGKFERKIAFAPAGESHEALASLWARAKIEHLMNQDLAAMQRGQMPDALKGPITQLGIEFRLMTQFTSFVAVEEQRTTTPGDPRKIAVPVDLPDGVSREGITGEKELDGPVVVAPEATIEAAPQMLGGASAAYAGVAGGGKGRGVGGGSGDGGHTGPLAAFGAPGPATRPVFGSGGSSRSVVFVLDNSAAALKSMASMKAELTRAIEGLRPIQKFNIVMTARGDKAPEHLSAGLLFGSDENKRLAGRLLDDVPCSGKTDVPAALAAAFAARPNLIYLLIPPDAKLAQTLLEKLRELNKDKSVKVNIVLFGTPDTATESLAKTIAIEQGGVLKVIDDAGE